MKILIFSSKEKLADYFASFLAGEISKNPHIVLGLATGKTMKPIYKKFAKTAKKKNLDLSKIKTVNLDEYANAKENDRNSLRYFMENNFFKPLAIGQGQIIFLNSFKNNLKDFDLAIKKSGDIDIQILGIGRNGHIGFNEPGSSIKSKTRRVKLNIQTIKDNRTKFTHALTTGISEILKSKKLILIATGRNKSDIIEKFFKHPISSDVPAAFLRKSKKLTVILDSAAASKIKNIKKFKYKALN